MGQWRKIAVYVVVLLVTACDRPVAPVAPPPPAVSVMAVLRRDTPLIAETIAEVKAFQEVEIRSRVGGMLDKVAFREGQLVTKGELLFVIDPLPLDSALADAAAQLAEAQANLNRAQQDVQRYLPLLPDNAIPRQTYDLAVSQEKQASSVVASRQANLERAKLDRSYAEIRSPINGRIGLQNLEAGSVVDAGQTVLATVSTLDPVYVYFSFPESAILRRMREVKAAAEAANGPGFSPEIKFVFADGTVYEHEGVIDFADRTINSVTGTLLLRAKFPNPEEFLQAGMNGRVLITYEIAKDALLVPQKAVTELLGKQFLTVLDQNNTVETRPVKMGSRVGELWTVLEGIKADEKIVVEGLLKVRPGMVVKPTLLAYPESESAKAAGSTAARPDHPPTAQP